MSCFAVFVLAVHFSLISAYANPFAGEENTRLDYYSQAYAQPYFHQTWKLFVPPPLSNYSLFAKYLDKNGETITVDIFSDALHKHQSNRLRGYGPILLSLVNSIHFVEKNELFEKRNSGVFSNDAYFKVLEHAALQYLRFRAGTNIPQAEFLLIVKDPSAGKIRAYYSKAYF